MTSTTIMETSTRRTTRNKDHAEEVTHKGKHKHDEESPPITAWHSDKHKDKESAENDMNSDKHKGKHKHDEESAD